MKPLSSSRTQIPTVGLHLERGHQRSNQALRPIKALYSRIERGNDRITRVQACRRPRKGSYEGIFPIFEREVINNSQGRTAPLAKCSVIVGLSARRYHIVQSDASNVD